MRERGRYEIFDISPAELYPKVKRVGIPKVPSTFRKVRLYIALECKYTRVQQVSHARILTS